MNGTIPESTFIGFQMTFAIITPALMIGAFVERMKFLAVIIFCLYGLSLYMRPLRTGYGEVEFYQNGMFWILQVVLLYMRQQVLEPW